MHSKLRSYEPFRGRRSVARRERALALASPQGLGSNIATWKASRPLRLFSNLESVQRGEPSALALAETIAASSLSFWLAWRFGSIQHIVLASALAPFLLVRTRLSTLYTLRLFEEAWEFLKDDGELIQICSILLLPLWKLFSTMKALWRHPIESVCAIPVNFFRNIAVVDSFVSPQVIPGSDEFVREFGIAGTNVYEILKGLWEGFGKFKPWEIPMIIIFWPIVALPLIASAVAYRWAVKSTAVIWLPLIWIVIQAQPGTQVMDRLVLVARSAWSKTMVTYSAFVVLAFFAKLGLLFGIWQLANLDWLGPLGMAATRLTAPFDLPLWQIAGAINGVLAVLFFYHADLHLLAQGKTEAWPEAWVRREYVFFQVVRTPLSLYVIACTFYITAAVAWQIEWPPIRIVLFPWSA
jgi:hypothetical protein